MRLFTLFGLLPLSCLSILGCSNAGQSAASAIVGAALVNQVPDNPARGAAALPVARKIIYFSQVDLVVEDLTAAQKTLESVIESVREQGGYLAKQELVGESGSNRQGSWTIRVPLGRFDGIVTQIEKLGVLVRSTRDAQDVTDAFTDLDARVRNLQSSEQRLLSHLEKSAQLKDTLELERELSRVRGEVEQLQGQLNLLKSKTDLATIAVTIAERKGYIPPTKPTFATMVSLTFRDSWTNLRSFSEGLALVAVALTPWVAAAVILALPIWLLRRLGRTRPMSASTAK